MPENYKKRNKSSGGKNTNQTTNVLQNGGDHQYQLENQQKQVNCQNNIFKLKNDIDDVVHQIISVSRINNKTK